MKCQRDDTVKKSACLVCRHLGFDSHYNIESPMDY